MWVQLKKHKLIDYAGTPTRYNPGDWVDVGRQSALRWIADGSAHIPSQLTSNELISPTAGIVIKNRPSENVIASLEKTLPSLPIGYSKTFEMQYTENLLYDGKLKRLRLEVIPVGLYWLKHFDMLAPFYSYTQLANNIGTPEDQRKTKEVIRELRVPFYETRMTFIRRCETTELFMEKWNDYQQEITDERLAFLCAMYEVKPFVYPLPVDWLR